MADTPRKSLTTTGGPGRAPNRAMPRGVGFTDALTSGLVVATTPNFSDTCGGSVGASAGSGTISLSNATIAANTVCSVQVDVQGVAAGPQIGPAPGGSRRQSVQVVGYTVAGVFG